MTTNISKIPIKKIKDVAHVLTPSAFQKMFADDAEQGKVVTYLLIPSRYVPNTFEASLMEGNILINGTAVIPKKEQLNIVYIAALFNSSPLQLLITRNRMGDNVPISAKTIGDMSIRIVNKEMQLAFGSLYLMLSQLRNYAEDNNSERYLNYKIQLFTELQDAIALQLILPRLFDTFDIDILGNWMNALGLSQDVNPNLQPIDMAKYISELLLDVTNPVMNELKKFRVALDVISKQFSQQMP